MSEIYKFPNGGHEVIVCKKQDILDCINENIVDKNIALALVKHCEKETAKYIKKGRWASIPFIGNIRIPIVVQMEKTEEQQLLINEAKEVLDSKQYIMFRKQLVGQNAKLAKNERLYRYLTSIAVKRNRYLYKKLTNKLGDVYARLFLYTSSLVKVVSENNNEPDYEQEFGNR